MTARSLYALLAATITAALCPLAHGATVAWSTAGYAQPGDLSAALHRARSSGTTHIEEFAARDDGAWILVTDDWIEASPDLPAWIAHWAGQYRAAGRTIDAIAFTPGGHAVLIAGDLLRHSSGAWPLKQALIDEIRWHQRWGNTITDLTFDADGEGFALTVDGYAICRGFDGALCAATLDAERSDRPVRQATMASDGAWMVVAGNWFAGDGVPAALRQYAHNWQVNGTRIDRVHFNSAGGYVRSSDGAWQPRAGDVLDRFEDDLDLWRTLDDLGTAALTFGYQAGPGQPVVARSYGALEAGTERWAGTDTRFSVQSISKTAAALVALEAVDAGAFDLDDPVAGMTAAGPLGLYQAVNAALAHRRLPRTVTPERLMSHTAGLPGHSSIGGGSGVEYWEGFDVPQPAELLYTPDCLPRGLGGCQPRPTDHWLWPRLTVGTYTYTNAGFALLMAVVEQATDTAFVDRAHALFARIGMNRATYGRHPGLAFDTVTTHDERGAVVPLRPVFATWAGEGLYASARDVVRMGRFILDRGLDARGRRIIAAGEVDQMRVDRRPQGVNPTHGYGLGLKMYRGTDGVMTSIIGHGGRALFGGQQTSSITALLAMNPDTGEVFTFAIAGGNADALRDRIERRIDDALGWPAINY